MTAGLLLSFRARAFPLRFLPLPLGFDACLPDFTVDEDADDR